MRKKYCKQDMNSSSSKMQLEEDKPHSTNAIKALENSNGTQEMPIHESSRGFFDVLSSRSSLQVPIPCIWVKCNSKDFLETYEICLRASQENGSSYCPLPGQHLYSSQGKGTDDEPYPTNDSTLGNIGFLINKDKSTLIPNKVQSFLGFQFNTQHMTIQATTIKIQKLETRIRQLFKVMKFRLCRWIVSLIGKITAMIPAVGDVLLHVKCMQRNLVRALQGSNHNWESS